MPTYNNRCPKCNCVMPVPTWRICNDCDSRTRKRDRPEKPIIKKYQYLMPEPFLSFILNEYFKGIKKYKRGGYIDEYGYIRPR